MKYLTIILLLLAAALPNTRGASSAPDAELVDRDWLKSVLVYSYYWYLEDHFFIDLAKNDGVDVWVRQVLPPALDEGDRSRFAEIWLPASRILLSVKKADYPLPELGTHVKNQHYRVVRGTYELDVSHAPPDQWVILHFAKDEVEALMAVARTQLHAPVPERRDFVINAMKREMTKANPGAGEQTVYVAARSDVSTSIWVYWLEGRVLYQFSGDIDGVDPSKLDNLPLIIRRFSLSSNVVASAEEANGRNSMITREFASRALFLCMARGEAVRIKPAATPPPAAAAKK